MRWILVGMVVVGGTLGDLLSTWGMKRHGEVREFDLRGMATLVGALVRNRYVIGGVVFLALSFLALLSLLSIADLSFAVPATAASYPVETLLAKYVLKERISRQRWAGCGMVTAGVGLLAF